MESSLSSSIETDREISLLLTCRTQTPKCPPCIQTTPSVSPFLSQPAWGGGAVGQRRGELRTEVTHYSDMQYEKKKKYHRDLIDTRPGLTGPPEEQSAMSKVSEETDR